MKDKNSFEEESLEERLGEPSLKKRAELKEDKSKTIYKSKVASHFLRNAIITVCLLAGVSFVGYFILSSVGHDKKKPTVVSAQKQPEPDFGMRYKVLEISDEITVPSSEELEKMIKNCEKALKRHPDNYLAYNNLGVAYLHSGELDEALDYFKKSIELNPKNASVWHNVGYLHLKLKNPTLAVRALEHALELDPKIPNTHYCLGIAYREKGDILRAIDEYKKEPNKTKVDVKVTEVSMPVNRAELHVGDGIRYRDLTDSTKWELMPGKYLLSFLEKDFVDVWLNGTKLIEQEYSFPSRNRLPQRFWFVAHPDGKVTAHD